MAVFGPHFVDEFPVQVNFALEEPFLPVFARVVDAEVEGHVVFVGQREEHFDQIRGRVVDLLAFEQTLERRGDPAAQSGADQHHRVDAHVLHRPEVGVPFAHAPILMGNVPTDLVEKGRPDGDGFEDAFGAEIVVGEFAGSGGLRRRIRRGAGGQHERRREQYDRTFHLRRAICRSGRRFRP